MSWWKRVLGQSDEVNSSQDKLDLSHKASSQHQSVPLCLEVIPEKLKVWVYQHELDSYSGLIPCWSYVTDGLWAHRHKEIIFTLQCSQSEEIFSTHPSIHKHIVEIFQGIYPFVEQGQMAHEGGCSWFSANLWGSSNWKAIVYVSPQPSQLQNLNLETQSPLMAAILLTCEEFEVYQSFGLTRVLSNLGRAYAYYPYPIWSQRSRSSVISVSEMEGSLLSKVPKLLVEGARVCLETIPTSIIQSPNPQPYLQQAMISWGETGTQVKLKLLSTAGKVLRSELSQCPPDSVLALLTDFDSEANGCLVWRSGQPQSFAITPPESTGSRMGGCFIAFVPQQLEDRGLVVEDGFVILLTDASWLAIREAIELRSSIFIPATNNGASFSLEWLPEIYMNPVDNRNYIAEEGWQAYSSSSGPTQTHRELVETQKIILLTSECELAARVQTKVLAAYIKRVEEAVQQNFNLQQIQSKQDLVLEFEVNPDNQVSLEMASRPGIEEERLENLYKSVMQIPSPKVQGGAIKFQIVFAISGKAGESLS